MEYAYFAQQALYLSVLVALPVLLVTALVALVVAVLQAATQLQDQTIAHVPRLLAASVAIAVASPWMCRSVSRFAEEMFRLAAM